MRLAVVLLLLVGLVIGPFMMWGDELGKIFSTTGAVAWLASYGHWAWLAGLVLILLDLFLPIPSTAVMAALGFVYGPFTGGLVSAAGSLLSGLLGYGLCRALGRRGAAWLLGERDLAHGEQIFARVGGWIVCLSRWLPVFPEVVACMAGLSRMRPEVFVVALTCGTLPLAFTFAAIGHLGAEHPVLAIGLSAGLPPLLWLLAHPLVRAPWR